MSDFSPFFLAQIGYENFPPERKRSFEKSLDELGFCIRATRMERVGDEYGRGNSRETLSDVYGE